MTVPHRLSRLALLCVTGALVAGVHAGSDDAPLAGDTTRPVAASVAAEQLPLPWGHDTNPKDESYGAYLKATGANKQLLAKIALRPRLRWYGSWVSNADIGGQIKRYIASVQNGDKNALVQLAVFRLWMHNGEAGRSIPVTVDDRNSYRQWIRYVAAAIGDTRTAIVLEPDLAMALTGYKPEYRFGLTKYAAQTLSANKNTSVYIDASSADWLSVDKSVAMLKQSGVGYARGFALGATHYDSVADNTTYAAKIIQALKTSGMPGKHAVLDTADNGKGFTYHQYYDAHPKGDFDNAETCTSTTATRCVTLGVPPTPDVPATAGTAADNIDGYLWFGRPWLYRQASPWKLDRALAAAKTTPY